MDRRKRCPPIPCRCKCCISSFISAGWFILTLIISRWSSSTPSPPSRSAFGCSPDVIRLNGFLLSLWVPGNLSRGSAVRIVLDFPTTKYLPALRGLPKGFIARIRQTPRPGIRSLVNRVLSERRFSLMGCLSQSSGSEPAMKGRPRQNSP